MRKLFFLIALLFTVSTGNQLLAQCASYDSSSPPPFPDTYPCMDFVLTNFTFCCDVEFDQFCIQQMRDHCNGVHDPTIQPCEFYQCFDTGCDGYDLPSDPFPPGQVPICGFCPSYSGTQPPPGDDPIEHFALNSEYLPINGAVATVIIYDGFCCTNDWDNCCWEIYNNPGTLASCKDPGIDSPLCDDGDPTTTDGLHPDLGCTHTPISLTAVARARAKIILEGAYDDAASEMRTTLRDKGFLPTSQPFSGAPWNYGGSESVASVSDLPADAVDWVLMELRDETDPTLAAIDTRAGILLKDGTIVEPDFDVSGQDGLQFLSAAANTNYHILIRARNHMDVMSAFTVFVSNLTSYDFTSGANTAKDNGTDQLVDVTDAGFGLYGMRSGDFSGDGRITVLDYIGGYLGSSSSLNGYFSGDTTKDGIVSVSDFNCYQQNLGVLAIDECTY